MVWGKLMTSVASTPDFFDARINQIQFVFLSCRKLTNTVLEILTVIKWGRQYMLWCSEAWPLTKVFRVGYWDWYWWSCPPVVVPKSAQTSSHKIGCFLLQRNWLESCGNIVGPVLKAMGLTESKWLNHGRGYSNWIAQHKVKVLNWHVACQIPVGWLIWKMPAEWYRFDDSKQHN